MSWITLDRLTEDFKRDATLPGQIWVAGNFVLRIVCLFYVG